MARAIAMPKLGMKMERGTVLEWRARPGERVEKGQVVALIETDKAEAELEAPAGGVLRHIYVEPEATVPCGAYLAALTDTADEEFDAAAFNPPQAAPVAQAAPAAPAAPPPARARAPSAPRPGGPVTPAARRRARELGLDPAGIRGTGPGGRVTREDVDAHAALEASRVTGADGVRLEARVEGDGDPVLLLPGFGVDGSVFARQVPALAERYRVCALNPRGVGLSEAPEADAYPVAAAAADAAAVIEAPAHVVGASLGAAAALELALARPERVRSLALITPFLRAAPRLLAVVDAWCRLAAAGDPETLAHALLPWLFGARTLGDERARRRALRGLVETAGRADPRALERSAAGLRAWSGTRDGASGPAVPVLVIGAADDLLTPDAGSVAAGMGARCEVVPEAGHAVALEAPDAVNAALLEHLGRC